MTLERKSQWFLPNAATLSYNSSCCSNPQQLILHNYNFATVRNHDVSIFVNERFAKEIPTHRLRTPLKEEHLMKW